MGKLKKHEPLCGELPTPQQYYTKNSDIKSHINVFSKGCSVVNVHYNKAYGYLSESYPL